VSTLLKPSVVSRHKLNLRWWKNAWNLASPPKGSLFLIHGIGEHSARYDEFASFMTTWGFDVFSFDLPGHGLTARRGSFERFADFDEMLAEAKDVYRFWMMEGPFASKDLRSKPVYFMGHSLGSILLLYWITKGKDLSDSLDGPQKIIVSSPPFQLKLKVPLWKETFARLLRHSVPDLKLGNEIYPACLSHDVVKVSEYVRDPWRSSKASPRLYFSLKASMAYALENVRNVEIPTLMISGSEDPIIEHSALEKFYGNLNTHKKWVDFRGYRHETLNEVGRDKVYEEVLRWIIS
jgi:alpha-beta hydrolase superfamily lysophospholipase